MSATKLARFSIIFASDNSRGIAKAGKRPWTSEEDLIHFRNVTVGPNVVIVGRHTYQKVFGEQPLDKKRTTYVISTTLQQEKNPGVSVFPSIKDALVAASLGKFREVFIGGGCTLFKEITSKWMYLCDNIYWTQFKLDFKCDVFFPESVLEGLPTGKEPMRTQSLVRHHLKPNYGHREEVYLDVLSRLISEEGGSLLERHLYGVSFEFSLMESFPLLTTNGLDHNTIIKLFNFALKGNADANILREQETDLFLKETSLEEHSNRADGLQEGDMGPWWGWILRHWGQDYETCDSEYSSALDQLQKIIEDVKTQRRGECILTNPVTDIYSMVECRYLSVEFIASTDRAFLDCVVHIKKSEVIEETGTDIALFGLLLTCVATVLKVKPRALKFLISDLWTPRREAAEKQSLRTPLPFPILTIRNYQKMNDIDSFTLNSFMVKAYDSWAPISLPRDGSANPAVSRKKGKK